jgi:hypothetical protein
VGGYGFKNPEFYADFKYANLPQGQNVPVPKSFSRKTFFGAKKLQVLTIIGFQ